LQTVAASNEALTYTENTTSSDVEETKMRQEESELTSDLLFVEEGEESPGPIFKRTFYHGRTYTVNSAECKSFQRFIRQSYDLSIQALTIYSSRNPAAKVTCSEPKKIHNLMKHAFNKRTFHKVVCSGRVFATGPCGSGPEICADCIRPCACNSGISIRPCMGGNPNWGGLSQTCQHPPSQSLYMTTLKKTTTTTTITTTIII